MHWCARQGRARRYASASWCRTVTLHGGCRRRTLLSASGLCCAKEPHFPEKLLRSRTYAQAAHGLSERPAGGARSRSACPRRAPQGAARSAGRPGLASSSSGAGLRRARRRRRRAPPGPDAGRRGSTPAFQNRRRESEARRRPPAAGPCEELTTPYFQSTSAAYQPFGFIPENSGSASVHRDALAARIARKTPSASCCVAVR